MGGEPGGSRLLHICCLAIALALSTFLSAQSTSIAVADSHPPSEPGEAEIWCLDPANSQHVVAAAVALGTAREHGENVEVDSRILTVRKWSRLHKEDFEAACQSTFTLYDPGAGDPAEAQDETEVEEWLIPLLSGFGGAALGGALAHASSLKRDRRLWIREDAAAIRRAAVELRHSAELASRADASTGPGGEAMARLKDAAAALSAFLDEPNLAGDAAATATRTDLQSLVDEAGKQEPDPNRFGSDGPGIAVDARANAAAWAAKINPKRRIPF